MIVERRGIMKVKCANCGWVMDRDDMVSDNDCPCNSFCPDCWKDLEQKRKEWFEGEDELAPC